MKKRTSFPKPVSAEELLKMDIPVESSEQAYRRGYRDGMTVLFDEIAGGLMLKSEYDALDRWIEGGALFRWWHQSHSRSAVQFPPEFQWPRDYGDRPTVPGSGSGKDKLRALEFPVFKFFTGVGGSAEFWCPFCHRWHHHSADPPGHRMAHCSPFNRSTGPLCRWGYNIRSYTKAELRKIYSMIKGVIGK